MWCNRLLKLSKNANVILVRDGHFMRGRRPSEAKTIKQVLEAQYKVDPETGFKVDIGFPILKRYTKEDVLKWSKNRRNLEHLSRHLKLVLPIEEVQEEWKKSKAFVDIRLAAEHYQVFDHLFGDAYFTPNVYLDVSFPQTDGRQAPVYRGNVVKPQEASQTPQVHYETSNDDLWTLIFTTPDGHLTEENKEYIHWMVGNIPGRDISKGDIIWDYMQPFPPLGIGFQRFIFVLYKQTKKIDYSGLKKKYPCLELSERTFSTLDFFRPRQDDLTPAGLAFFQSDWDPSVRTFFHEKLNMEEPRFEYEHVKPYVAPQKWFPKKKAFNLYLDKYRDPRDIAKDFLVKKLQSLNPFERPKKPFPYSNIYRMDRTKMPSWLITELRREKLQLGRINHQKDE